MKVPYNSLAKAKVTLAFVGLLYKQKWAVENEVDRFRIQVENCLTSPKKNGLKQNRPSLVE
jgi:hypothetical protein